MPSTLPPLGTVAQRIYARLEPAAVHDPANGYALAVLVGGIGAMLQPVHDLAREGDDDEPGWSSILDVDRAPADWLPWLAVMVGVVDDPRLDEAGRRERIRALAGQKRGTPAAMIAAAQQSLTGTRRVIFNERADGNPYLLRVRTIDAETPDAARVLADLRTQKPAGLVLEYGTVTGMTYDALYANFDSYAQVAAEFASYDALRSSPP